MHDSFGSKQFYEAVGIVFTTTPETDTRLRELVVKRVSGEKTRYTMGFNLDLQAALKNVPDLAFWVLRYEEETQKDVKNEPNS
jgi:hypothetical protein